MAPKDEWWYLRVALKTVDVGCRHELDFERSCKFGGTVGERIEYCKKHPQVGQGLVIQDKLSSLVWTCREMGVILQNQKVLPLLTFLECEELCIKLILP